MPQDNNRRRFNKEEYDPFEEQIVQIDRVSKTVKGGKRMRFRVLVVVGNKDEGTVGVALGKAKEIPAAIRKAVTRAKRDMIKVPKRGTTIPHDITSRIGGVRVYLAPAVPGTGIIAGGIVRMVLEKAGLKDVISKAHGSTNAMNLAKTTLKAIKELKDPVEYAKQRGITVSQMFGTEV